MPTSPQSWSQCGGAQLQPGLPITVSSPLLHRCLNPGLACGTEVPGSPIRGDSTMPGSPAGRGPRFYISKNRTVNGASGEASSPELPASRNHQCQSMVLVSALKIESGSFKTLQPPCVCLTVITRKDSYLERKIGGCLGLTKEGRDFSQIPSFQGANNAHQYWSDYSIGGPLNK